MPTKALCTDDGAWTCGRAQRRGAGPPSWIADFKRLIDEGASMRTRPAPSNLMNISPCVGGIKVDDAVILMSGDIEA